MDAVEQRALLYGLVRTRRGQTRRHVLGPGRGREAEGQMVHTWTETGEYYFTEGLDRTWQRRAKAAYGEARQAVAEHEEARAWLRVLVCRANGE